MKRFTFQLIITEQDLCGDEFWEEAIRSDGTGIADEDSNLIVSKRKTKEFLRLKKVRKRVMIMDLK